MAKNTKPTQSLLNENTVRRFMKLADIPELTDSFVNEEWGTKKDEESRTKKGEEDYTTKKGKKKKGDEAFVNEDAVVNEVARRVAARLAKQDQKDAMADQLAERIMARLVK